MLAVHLDITQSTILTNFCCYNSDIVFCIPLSVQGFTDKQSSFNRVNVKVVFRVLSPPNRISTNQFIKDNNKKETDQPDYTYQVQLKKFHKVVLVKIRILTFFQSFMII